MYQEKVALYLRLSREDEEKKTESESIKNQKAFLMEYAEKRGWAVYDIYIDDGVSGTTFDRPGFLRLIADIEKGSVNTVISKDLSRLGRDYIQTGFYLEKYFPSKRVRFIAVNDAIDTGNEDESNNEMSPFRSVINDMYARDISKKIRTALTTKKKNGRFIGSFAPYGYRKDPSDKGHLIIDEATAPIVRDIFRLYLDGKSVIAIAKHLTNNKIPTPSQNRGYKFSQTRFTGLWSDSMVKRILTSETYIGNLTQNRSRKIGYKVDKKVNLSKNDWIIVEGTHEGIIDVDTFKAVQKILSQKTYIKKDDGKAEHLLSGLVYCGKCSSPMTFVRESPTRTYLVCSAWKKYGSLGICTSHCIREDKVEALILDLLRQLSSQADVEAIINKLQKESGNYKAEQTSSDIFRLKSEFYARLQTDLYKDKARGIINEEQYICMSKKFLEEFEELKRLYESIQNKIPESGEGDTLRKRISEFLEFNTIQRSLLVLLVNKVKISDDKKVEICFSFKPLSYI